MVSTTKKDPAANLLALASSYKLMQETLKSGRCGIREVCVCQDVFFIPISLLAGRLGKREDVYRRGVMNAVNEVDLPLNESSQTK